MVRVKKQRSKGGIRPSARGSHKLLSIGESLVFPSISPIVVGGSTLGTMAGWRVDGEVHSVALDPVGLLWLNCLLCS